MKQRNQIEVDFECRVDCERIIFAGCTMCMFVMGQNTAQKYRFYILKTTLQLGSEKQLTIKQCACSVDILLWQF